MTPEQPDSLNHGPYYDALHRVRMHRAFRDIREAQRLSRLGYGTYRSVRSAKRAYKQASRLNGSVVGPMHGPWPDPTAPEDVAEAA